MRRVASMKEPVACTSASSVRYSRPRPGHTFETTENSFVVRSLSDGQASHTSDALLREPVRMSASARLRSGSSVISETDRVCACGSAFSLPLRTGRILCFEYVISISSIHEQWESSLEHFSAGHRGYEVQIGQFSEQMRREQIDLLLLCGLGNIAHELHASVLCSGAR